VKEANTFQRALARHAMVRPACFVEAADSNAAGCMQGRQPRIRYPALSGEGAFGFTGTRQSRKAHLTRPTTTSGQQLTEWHWGTTLRYPPIIN